MTKLNARCSLLAGTSVSNEAKVPFEAAVRTSISSSKPSRCRRSAGAIASRFLPESQLVDVSLLRNSFPSSRAPPKLLSASRI